MTFVESFLGAASAVIISETLKVVYQRYLEHRAHKALDNFERVIKNREDQ